MAIFSIIRSMVRSPLHNISTKDVDASAAVEILTRSGATILTRVGATIVARG